MDVEPVELVIEVTPTFAFGRPEHQVVKDDATGEIVLVGRGTETASAGGELAVDPYPPGIGCSTPFSSSFQNRTLSAATSSAMLRVSRRLEVGHPVTCAGIA
jgi:hypothetical protein